ncbi:MAG: reverse transcriptase domain-containing protein [Bacillota bacterium]
MKENGTVKKVHSLIDKVYHPTNLRMAWETVKANKGSGGIDKIGIPEFEKMVEEELNILHLELKQGIYKPMPVRRVNIPKRGKPKETRPLGIPTVEDRLVQRAVARILEAIFEQDFLNFSYGFRPGRSPHQALQSLRSIIVTKKVRHIFEADIRGYFSHINHEWLMKMLKQRIADPVILRLA